MRSPHGIVFGLLALALACSRDGGPRSSSPSPEAAPSTTHAPAAPSGSRVSTTPASIGVARMRADGTLELDLRGPGGAEARVVYPPTHVEYKKTLDHLGGMKPGEDKPGPPWPDPWDASKVESAAHAHAAKKGWKRDEYTIEIMGTDADGNAVVSVAHAADRRARTPGASKSVSIRIETKSYTVVKELASQ